MNELPGEHSPLSRNSATKRHVQRGIPLLFKEGQGWLVKTRSHHMDVREAHLLTSGSFAAFIRSRYAGLTNHPFPLLEKEGWMRGQKYREATLVRADGVVRPAKVHRPEDFRRSDHPVCGSWWLRIFLLMPQPPLLFKEGKYALPTIHSQLQTAPYNLLVRTRRVTDDFPGL